ncbi:hypothetical protein TcCL_ESM06399 [Trypanosoma cruzi]|nr:hypothetical protein TcCL_ESM06399 [Trypanosoma cruzi]
MVAAEYGFIKISLQQFIQKLISCLSTRCGIPHRHFNVTRLAPAAGCGGKPAGVATASPECLVAVHAPVGPVFLTAPTAAWASRVGSSAAFRDPPLPFTPLLRGRLKRSPVAAALPRILLQASSSPGLASLSLLHTPARTYDAGT